MNWKIKQNLTDVAIILLGVVGAFYLSAAPANTPPALPILPESIELTTNAPMLLTASWSPGSTASNPPAATYNVWTNGALRIPNTHATSVSFDVVSLPVTVEVSAVGSNGLESARVSLVYPTPRTNIWVWSARQSTSFPSQLATAGVPYTNWPAITFTNIDAVPTNMARPEQWLWVVATNR